MATNDDNSGVTTPLSGDMAFHSSTGTRVGAASASESLAPLISELRELFSYLSFCPGCTGGIRWWCQSYFECKRCSLLLHRRCFPNQEYCDKCKDELSHPTVATPWKCLELLVDELHYLFGGSSVCPCCCETIVTSSSDCKHCGVPMHKSCAEERRRRCDKCTANLLDDDLRFYEWLRVGEPM